MGNEKKSMTSLMTEDRKFPPPKSIAAKAHVSSMEQYQQMWEQSINDPDKFWLEQAKSLTWFKNPTKGLEYTWDTQNRKIEHTWFADGLFSYNNRGQQPFFPRLRRHPNYDILNTNDYLLTSIECCENFRIKILFYCSISSFY